MESTPITASWSTTEDDEPGNRHQAQAVVDALIQTAMIVGWR